jgi:LPXTG-motif cell wall-anchored protein
VVDPRDTITIRHRIERDASGDGLRIITTGNDLPRSWSLAWLFLAGMVLFAGLWLVRRRRKRLPA